MSTVSAHSPVAHLTGEVPKFDVVEAVTPVGAAPCFECRGPIVDTYYECGGHVICVGCQRRLAADVTHTTGDGRFLRALAFGLGAAALGTTIYLGLVAVTGREVELVAILVGFMVGRAVRHGSGGRGGRRYQWLAVALTYLAIAGTYAPFVMRGFGNDATMPAGVIQAAPAQSGALLAAPMSAAPPSASAPPVGAATAGAGALLMLAAAAPALAGLADIANIAITLAALAIAWRMNRRTTLEITGPYFVRQASATTRHR